VDDKINICYTFHTGANRHYISKVLFLMDESDDYDVQVARISLNDFIESGVPKGTDVLLYQTFPDEHNRGKFNPRLIGASDWLFREFGGLKILACTHDSGDADSFSRFIDSKSLPRIKCFPSKMFMSKYNVILLSTFSTHTNEEVYPDLYERNIIISCKFGRKKYHHRIRECVEETLKNHFADLTDFTWVENKREYLIELQRTLITVGAPGWGRHNASYAGALKAGSLLFAHRTLNDCYFLPHGSLVDGEDYISYDLYNLKVKLQSILDNPKEIERVRKNGRRAFQRGYNYKKSADLFYNYLKREIK